MTRQNVRGQVYFCSVCGSELSVIGRRVGEFRPRCCNTDMIQKPLRMVFYFCPVCGAEIGIVKEGKGAFEPVCCNRPMVREAA